jgi:hypothetical protein
MKAVLEGDVATHLLVLTRTAHPSLPFAGAALGLTTIVYVEGQSEHSHKHADSILKGMCVHKTLPDVRKSVEGHGGKHLVHLHGIQFIEAEVPPPSKQIIQLRDVEPAETSFWRAGINTIPRDLEKKIAELAVQDTIQMQIVCYEEAETPRISCHC